MAEWSERYPYSERDVRAHASSTGGVYRLINKSGEKYLVFYVGQTNDLQRRLLEHLSPDEPDACIKGHVKGYSCYFRFIQISSASERVRVEKEQIQQWKPSCNG